MVDKLNYQQLGMDHMQTAVFHSSLKGQKRKLWEAFVLLDTTLMALEGSTDTGYEDEKLYLAKAKELVHEVHEWI